MGQELPSVARRNAAVGARVATAMVEAGFNQTRLAAALGASRSLVCQYLSGGRAIPMRRLYQIAAVLRCSVAELAARPLDARLELVRLVQTVPDDRLDALWAVLTSLRDQKAPPAVEGEGQGGRHP